MYPSSLGVSVQPASQINNRLKAQWQVISLNHQVAFKNLFNGNVLSR